MPRRIHAFLVFSNFPFLSRNGEYSSAARNNHSNSSHERDHLITSTRNSRPASDSDNPANLLREIFPSRSQRQKTYTVNKNLHLSSDPLKIGRTTHYDPVSLHNLLVKVLAIIFINAFLSAEACHTPVARQKMKIRNSDQVHICTFRFCSRQRLLEDQVCIAARPSAPHYSND